MRTRSVGKNPVAVVVLAIAAYGLVWSYASDPAVAQSTPQKSVGRGWPVPVPLRAYHGYPQDDFVGAVTPWYYQTSATATGGKAPANVTPLERDIFTSRDFYADRTLWMDKRYYRCNSPIALDSIWGDYSSGPGALDNGNPATAAWGHCDRDYPREAIVSPYPFTTAQAHYDALLAETKARGGPTVHTKATVPGDWTGRYGLGGTNWYGSMRANQVPTILSLLTPEYQKRMVQ